VLAECEAAKAVGNAAVSAKDYAAAEGHYSQALNSLPSGGLPDTDANAVVLLHATLLCNRAVARHQQGSYEAAAEDAGAALQQLPDGGDPKLRVKALYRRALACEAMGELQSAFEDLNLALKVAPTNEGILTAAKRIKELLPKAPAASLQARAPPAYAPINPYNTADIMRLADADCFPERLKGYSGETEDPVVRFPSGLGVQARYETGGTLLAIRAFAGPRRAPGDVFNMARDFHARPNFPPADGLCAKYAKEGHLREIFCLKDGEIEGPLLFLYPNGTLDTTRSHSYKAGKVQAGYISSDIDKPSSHIAHALVDLVVPVKKALQIALSPGEQKLLEGLRLNVDSIHEADLTQAGKAAAEHRKWLEDRVKDPLKEKHMMVGEYVMQYPAPPTTWSLPEEKRVVKMR